DARDVYSQAYLKLARPDATVLARAEQADSDRRAMGGAVRMESTMAPPPAPVAAAPGAAPEMSRAMPKQAKLEKDGFGLLDQDESAANAPMAIRSDFNPLAAFSPAVHTDAAGRATVELTLPDNLTRYRVVAIAVAGDKQFGKGESALTARLPLMVRPSPPRFLNFGDMFQLPIVVQNQTDAPMTVRVAVRGGGGECRAGRRRRPRGLGAAQRACRGAVPGRGRDGGHGAVPDRRRGRPCERCLGAVAPGVDAGDDRGVCDLRCDRRQDA